MNNLLQPSYNLSINTNEGDNGHIPVDWDDLWEDPDYTTWENERMSAYNAESANQPIGVQSLFSIGYTGHLAQRNSVSALLLSSQKTMRGDECYCRVND